MNFDNIRNEMEVRGITPEEYEPIYKNLLDRTETSISAIPGGDWGNPRRIHDYALVLRQALLHRAIKLFEGSVYALIQDNGYLLALSVRGHFETTAALGFLHNRLTSLRQGNLTPYAVDKDICKQVMGTRDEKLLDSAGQEREFIEAKQVLNMLEYADKSVSKHVLGETAKKHTILMDIYKWLCEFSHPNFLSNILAFTLDKNKREFHFSYDRNLSILEASLIHNLLVSSPIFEDLYDRIDALLPTD